MTGIEKTGYQNMKDIMHPFFMLILRQADWMSLPKTPRIMAGST